jgi:integrase
MAKRGPYLKRGLTRHHGGWRWKLAVPGTLRALVGKSEWSRYLGADRDAAELEAMRLTLDHKRLIRGLRTLTPAQRSDSTMREILARPLIPLSERDAPVDGSVGTAIDHAGIQRIHATILDGAGSIEPDPAAPYQVQARQALAASHARQAAAALRTDADKTFQLASKIVAVSPDKFVEPLIKAWVRTASPRQETTIHTYRRHATRFAEFAGNVTPRTVTRKHALDWRDDLERQPKLSPKSQAKHLDSLARLFDVGMSEGLCDANPFRKVAVRKQAGTKFADGDGTKSFTRDHMRAIFAAMKGEHPDIQWVIRLMAYHGARSGELCQLRKDDIATVDGVLCIRIHDRYGSIKNADSLRDVPVHPAVRKELLAYAKAAKGPWLFGSFPDWRGRAGKFQRRGKHILSKLAKIDGMTMHDFRHTWTTLSRNVDMPEAVSRAIQGHSLGKDVHSKYGDGPSLKIRAKWIAKIDPVRQAPLAYHLTAT